MKDNLILLKCYKVVNSCENLTHLKIAENYIKLYSLMNVDNNEYNNLYFFWRNKFIEMTKNNE